MRDFIGKHPALTQFFVLVGVVVLSIPLWALLWYGIAETGRIVIDEGCQARGYSCEYESATMVIALLVFMPFFFYFFIFAANKISGLITDRLLSWAGLNPKTALS